MNPYRATAVAIKGKAVLLEGPSAAGKSDLALRMINLGAILVSDDYVELKEVEDKILASPPKNITGKLEVRGIGIQTFPFLEGIPVALVISLVPRNEVPRMPEETFIDIHGRQFPKYNLYAFDSSTPDKIFMLLGKNR